MSRFILHYFTSFIDVSQSFYITLRYILNVSTAKKIGDNLKRARKDKGLTQKEVADKMNMTQQQYSRFENGVFELDYDRILFLCKLLDISANDLFDIT